MQLQDSSELQTWVNLLAITRDQNDRVVLKTAELRLSFIQLLDQILLYFMQT